MSLRLFISFWVNYVHIKISRRFEISFWSKWLEWNPYFFEFNLPQFMWTQVKKDLTKHGSDLNFLGNYLKNTFRHLKLYSNLPSWLARSRCHMDIFSFERQKIEVHIFKTCPFGIRNLLCAWVFVPLRF